MLAPLRHYPQPETIDGGVRGLDTKRPPIEDQHQTNGPAWGLRKGQAITINPDMGERAALRHIVFNVKIAANHVDPRFAPADEQAGSIGAVAQQLAAGELQGKAVGGRSEYHDRIFQFHRSFNSRTVKANAAGTRWCRA